MQIKNIPTIFTDGWYKGNLHTSAFTPIQGKKNRGYTAVQIPD